MTGELLLISVALFRDAAGVLKIAKRDRAPYVRLFADAIKAPDEIWQDWAEIEGKRVLRRRYVALWELPGRDTPALAVFETGKQGWVGVTAFSPADMEYLERRARRGERVYVRNEQRTAPPHRARPARRSRGGGGRCSRDGHGEIIAHGAHYDRP